MIQQSVPFVHLDRIILGCCGWGDGDAIGSNVVDDIGVGEASGGENNNQHMMGMRVIMAMG